MNSCVFIVFYVYFRRLRAMAKYFLQQGNYGENVFPQHRYGTIGQWLSSVSFREEDYNRCGQL